MTAICVALFRADEDSRATAARLAERGFASAIAPVLEPTSVAAQAPEGPFGAVAATSAKAFGFASPSLVSQLRDLPFYVVGSAGRKAAERSELAVAYEAQDAKGLARRLLSAPIKHNTILYITGVDRKADFETLLADAGIGVVVVEAYEARARSAWNESEVAAIKKASAALHYSRRSAEVATRLADSAGLATPWRRLSHVAISEDAAAPLRAAGLDRILVAQAPQEASMLEGLAQLFPAPGAPPLTILDECQGGATKGQGSLPRRPPLYTARSEERAGMADETIQDDHPIIPPASVPKAEREPVTIDGEVIGATPETPADEPLHAEAHDAESTPDETPVAATAEAASAPAEPLPQAPPPASNPRGGSVISAGVGALIGAAAALAVSYGFQPSAPDLQPLTNKLAALDSAISGEVTARKALESRLATLEAKPAPAAPSAAPSKDTAALEARLKKLEGSAPNADALAATAADAKAARNDAAKALATVAALGAANGSTDAGAPNPEIAKLVGDQQSLGDRFAKLEASFGALKSAVPAGPDPELEKLAGDEKALTERVNKLEAAFEAPKTDVRADPNVVAKGDPVAQSVAAIELERRLTAGQSYAVEWAALDKLGADAKSLAALKPYAQNGAPTLATLSAGFAKLAPDLGTPATKPDHGGYTDALWDEVKGLVKVHPAGEIKGDDPTAVTTQISAALARGDVLAARAGYAKLPERQRELAASWAKDLDGVIEAKAAAVSLIETSLSRLSDQKN